MADSSITTPNMMTHEKETPKTKNLPSGIVIPPKKAPLTKAERRALQEQQRAAKGLTASGSSIPPAGSTTPLTNGSSTGVLPTKQRNEETTKKSQPQPQIREDTNVQPSLSRKGSTLTETSDTKGGHHSSLSSVSKGGGHHHSHPSSIMPPQQQQQQQLQQQQQHSGNLLSSTSSGFSGTLFSHLPPYKDPKKLQEEFSGIHLGPNPSLPLTAATQTATVNSATSNPSHTNTNIIANPNSPNTSSLHPAVLHLGYLYASGILRGANARCRAMLRTFQIVLQDYSKPPHVKDIRQDIDSRILKPSFQYWTSTCRTHSISMGNAFSFLKLAVVASRLHDRDRTEDQVKIQLLETIDAYIQERIEFADKAIVKYASSKIMPQGDVLLTYGRSEVIELLLLHAALEEQKQFRVICVDSRPLLEGRILLEKLTQAGIPCTYVLLNSLSYVLMRDVTKVFLGAAALMSNGSILSRVGTACVALMAQKAAHVPVLVCCETYKISNRVQLESITRNELGNPEQLLSQPCALNRNCDANDSVETSSSLSTLSQNYPHLKLLSFLYDLTPSKFVSGIVTEMGILPPTSVSVLLREMNPQDTDLTWK